MGHPNWYAGLSNAATGLGQSAQVTAQRELEEMKDKRAENLARMTFNWHAQHDTAMQERSLEHDTRMDEMHEQLETQREGSLQDRQEKSSQAYFERMQAVQDALGKRQQGELDARDKVENQREIARMRIAMQEQLRQHDATIAQQQRQLSDAVKGELSISMISDPQKKAQAIMADPMLGPMVDQLHQEQVARSKTTAFYTMSLASMGDPLFQGKQKSDLPPDAQSAAAPSADQIQNPGAAAIAKGQNWTDAQVQQELNAEHDTPNPKGIDSDPTSPDNTAPATQPGNLATGMPPTVGPARTPVTTNLGPLRTMPQLIPNGASQQAAAPTLIPQSSAPSSSTFGSWLNNHPVISEAYMDLLGAPIT